MNVINIGFRTIDIDVCLESHDERHLLHLIIGMLKHQQKTIETIRTNMITAESLAQTTQNLIDAVTGAIGNIGNNPASTPDNVVLAFQTGVQAQVDRLNTAENPPPPPPPTP